MRRPQKAGVPFPKGSPSRFASPKDGPAPPSPLLFYSTERRFPPPMRLCKAQGDTMNKVFLFALQLGVLAPFGAVCRRCCGPIPAGRPKGRCGISFTAEGRFLIACALARWRILKGKETFSLIQAVCGVLLALLVSTVFVWVGASERGHTTGIRVRLGG